MKHSLAIVLTFSALALGASLPAAAQAEPLSADERALLVELVEQASRINPRAQPPDVLIGGLRMLRDPALRPLYTRLAASDLPGLRMHGALGLAELDEERGLDASLLATIENPLEQTSLFSQAARAGQINERNLAQILAWSDISPDLEAAALQRSLNLGLDIDAARARRLAGNESVAVAIMGGLILLELGKGDDASAPMRRFFELPPDVRRPIAGMLLQHIRRESMRRSSPFVERIAAEAEEAGDELLQIEAAHTLLQTDSQRAAPFWMSLYDASADPATRLMLAIAALESAHSALAPLYERLIAEAPDSPLLADMGRAGLALGAGESGAEALVALAAHGHGPSCQWITVAAEEELPEHVATPALVAVIRAAAGVGEQRVDVRSASISAAALLAERAPDALAGMLRELAEARNESMCQSLLVGALRARATSAGFLPDGVRWPGRQSAALAELAAARFGDPATPQHQENLRAIALGRASLPEVFRVQAAWLALRGAGEEQAALR